MLENLASNDYNTLSTARAIEFNPNPQNLIGTVNPLDPLNYYSFTLSGSSSINITLSELNANADLELLNSQGKPLQTSVQLGINSESIWTTLEAGRYYIKVYADAETTTSYELSLSSTSSEEGKSTTNKDVLTGLSNPEFDTGVFTVGASGEVSIDYLFDGGAYQGELAIFSLEGMKQFEANINEFIAEAAHRALSNSQLGHVVISDSNNGARFQGAFAWEDDYNSGEYLGVQTFSMRPGDTFGVMLVPNGTVQQVLDNPTSKGDIRLLFSLSTINPLDAFHVGQIADVTGDNNTFVMEDLRVDGCSDQDYNDIVFQVRGATGTALHLDEVIDSNYNWQTTDLGKTLMNYVTPYITPNSEADIHEEELPEIIDISQPLPPKDELGTLEEDGYNFAQSNQPLIGVIDTGFSANNEYPDSITLGYDYVDNDTNPLLQPGEENEHGTHILSVINSENDDAPLWVSRAISSGQWAEALIEFVNAAKDSGQPNAVVNLSFDLIQTVNGNETTRYEFTPEEWAALKYSQQHEVLVVAAAGNDADTMSALGQASQQFDNIITVGSAQNLDSSVAVFQGYDRAYYSSYGNGLSLVADGGTPDAPVLSVAGEMSGTSVAVAKVTGAISQVWAANPQLSYQQVIDIINSTATDLLSPNWDAQTGTGLLNKTAAVDLAKVTDPRESEVQIPAIPITWSSADNPSERAVSTEFQDKYYNWYSYTIKPGDTLSMIALRTMGNGSYPYYNFIADYNGITNPSLIYTDQIIQIPTEVSVPTDEFMGKYYVWEPYIIQEGDTLTQIALQRMGSDSQPYYNFIAQKNGIADPNLIIVGDTIFVPLEVSAPTAPNPPINQPQPINPNKFYKPLSSYTVTSEFGWRTDPISGKQRLHGGIDLAAPKGTPVKAAKGGTVVYAGWNNQGYGNLVIIEHGSGVRTYYAHLSSVSVSNGSQVSAGATVGGVGSTGYSTGNHLHFEVRVNNQRKNPRDYVQF